MMDRQWNVQPCAKVCATTGQAFAESDLVYSVLIDDGVAYRRVDFSAQGWESRESGFAPVSFWKTEYRDRSEPPPAEALPKNDAESLLRIVMDDPARASPNAPYILAVMLERKRVLRHIDTIRGEGTHCLVYEHARTGESFTVRDPRLRLDQLEEVQREIVALLDGHAGPPDRPPDPADPTDAAPG